MAQNVLPKPHREHPQAHQGLGSMASAQALDNSFSVARRRAANDQLDCHCQLLQGTGKLVKQNGAQHE